MITRVRSISFTFGFISLLLFEPKLRGQIAKYLSHLGCNAIVHVRHFVESCLNHVWLLLPSLRVTIREENLKKFDSLFAVGMERRGPVELRETIVGQKFFEI